MIAVSKAFGTAFFWQPLAKSCKIWYTGIILCAIANRNNDLQSAVFDGGRRTAPLSAPLYALCQSHIVALAEGV